MNSYSEIGELRLVDLARHDSAAFAELYQRNVQAVHAFAQRRTGTTHDADDITAVTFERALRKLSSYRPGTSGLIGWLYRIASNEIIDQARRRERQHSQRGQQALRLLHEQPNSDATAEAPEADPELIAALDHLSDRYNAVLSLRFIAGLDPADTATRLGISPGNCAVLTHRALAALRAQLLKGATK